MSSPTRVAAGRPAFRLGTMGFGYAQWAGVFYPRDLKSTDYLSFYARFFDTVELDTTFHANPPVSHVEKWAAETPDHFRFTAKAPRQITHEQGLEEALSPMLEFLDHMRHLGEKLSAILLQFPPALSSDAAPILHRFLEQLPGDIRYAIEFRHPSWQTDRTLELLSRLHMAWVEADYLDAPAPPRATTDFLYLRWVGIHGAFPTMNQEEIDVSDRLAWWRDRLLATPAAVKTIFGFFNNDYAGYSIASANRLKGMLNLPAKLPTPMDRGELFG